MSRKRALNYAPPRNSTLFTVCIAYWCTTGSFSRADAAGGDIMSESHRGGTRYPEQSEQPLQLDINPVDRRGTSIRFLRATDPPAFWRPGRLHPHPSTTTNRSSLFCPHSFGRFSPLSRFVYPIIWALFVTCCPRVLVNSRGWQGDECSRSLWPSGDILGTSPGFLGGYGSYDG